ncbi:alcohol dehydrogenase catalytic domain-containing protein [Streptomyces sp. NPDC052043]|uniref:alcohol dehydrogenase catalytic domain-containing protein n=1 Tax=Streptomyces sp. NPDC052043 TaxID=3365684 RepID=UPI0037D4B3F6
MGGQVTAGESRAAVGPGPSLVCRLDGAVSGFDLSQLLSRLLPTVDNGRGSQRNTVAAGGSPADLARRWRRLAESHGSDHGSDRCARRSQHRRPRLQRPHDLLVRVRAVSVNPIDAKTHARLPAGHTRVLGCDAAGSVEAVGAQVTGFRVADEVYYAGDLTRDGTNAAYHAVDARLVGRSSAAIQLTKAPTNLRVLATASRDESRDWALACGADGVVNTTTWSTRSDRPHPRAWTTSCRPSAGTTSPPSRS